MHKMGALDSDISESASRSIGSCLRSEIEPTIEELTAKMKELDAAASNSKGLSSQELLDAAIYLIFQRTMEQLIQDRLEPKMRRWSRRFDSSARRYMEKML